METIDFTPKYKNQAFNTKKEFEEWLEKTTHKQLVFEDHGQDLQRMFIADNGEIIHCDFQARIYNGLFVNLEALEEFTPVQIWEDGQWKRKLGLVIEEVIG